MSSPPTSVTQLDSKARSRHKISDRNLGSMCLGDERPRRSLKAGSYRSLHNSLAELALSPQAHKTASVRGVSEGNHVDHRAQSQHANRSQPFLPSQARMCPLDRTGRNHMIGMQLPMCSSKLNLFAHTWTERLERHGAAIYSLAIDRHAVSIRRRLWRRTIIGILAR